MHLLSTESAQKLARMLKVGKAEQLRHGSSVLLLCRGYFHCAKQVETCLSCWPVSLAELSSESSCMMTAPQPQLPRGPSVMHCCRPSTSCLKDQTSRLDGLSVFVFAPAYRGSPAAFGLQS